MPVSPAKKSPVMGIIALLIVVVAGVIFFLSGYRLYDAIFSLPGVDITGGAIPDTSSFTPEELQGLAGWVAGIGISSLIGIAGFVVAIIATAKKRGRAFGILGIVVGVLAPFTIFIAAGMAVAAHGGL